MSDKERRFVRQPHRVFNFPGKEGWLVGQAGQEQSNQQQSVVDVEGGVPPHTHCLRLHNKRMFLIKQPYFVYLLQHQFE